MKVSSIIFILIFLTGCEMPEHKQPFTCYKDGEVVYSGKHDISNLVFGKDHVKLPDGRVVHVDDCF